MKGERSRVILPDEWRWRRWRNGGGRTAEIHIEGEAAAPDWRLSLAIIERDGPFSAWPGMNRTLVWLDGGLLKLDIHNDCRSLERLGARTDFTGEHAVAARVTQPTSVLNLMVRRGAGWQAAAPAPAAAATTIVHATRPASIVAGGRTFALPAHATLFTPTAVERPRHAEPIVVLELHRSALDP